MSNRLHPPKIFFAVYLAVLLLLVAFSPVQAQQDEFKLNVNKSYGFNNGSQIRGTFTASIAGPAEKIKTVSFFIDGKLMEKQSEAPFKLKFQTTAYNDGWHELNAIVETSDGRTITTSVKRFNFVSAQVESSFLKNTIFPILGAVLAVTIIGLAVQMLVMRKKAPLDLPLGSPRQYGLRGGTICPRCKRPFVIHWWAFNISLAGRYDRCDFCGKWSVVRALSQDALRSAEAAELEMAQPGEAMHTKTEEEKLRELLDSSKYTDQP